MAIEIVLYNPLIPQNTGSIARLTAANKLKLNLIEPLGFELSDKYLKRAGLDYWQYVNYEVFPSWENFSKIKLTEDSSVCLFSKKAERNIFEAKYTANDYLVFGSETSGLPNELHQRFSNKCYRIPMEESNVRSLNLATSVGIVTYEALRQLKFSKQSE